MLCRGLSLKGMIMQRTVTRLTLAAFLASQICAPALAQTKPAPQPEIQPTPLPAPKPTPKPLPKPLPKPRPKPKPLPKPVPLPQPVPETKPVPLPQPVPETKPVPLPGPVNGNGGYAATVRCDARGNLPRRCNVRHENRVALIDRHDGKCRQSRDWGYDRWAIWVSNGCRATFAYGNGTYWPEPEKDKGPNAGLIIGGVVVAAGLVALLASKNKKPKEEAEQPGTPPEPETPATFPPGPPAAITADLSTLTAAQKPAMQTCLFQASQEIGATGGTKLKLDGITEIQPGNGGWRFRAKLIGTYPDGDRELPIYCRATSTKVVQLDFGS